MVDRGDLQPVETLDQLDDESSALCQLELHEDLLGVAVVQDVCGVRGDGLQETDRPSSLLLQCDVPVEGDSRSVETELGEELVTEAYWVALGHLDEYRVDTY